jgi:F-type H+-transporting ATPase subunit b
LKRNLRYPLWLLLGAATVAGGSYPAKATPSQQGLVTAVMVEPPAAQKSSARERVFDWINFAILIAVLVYFLRKPIAQFFSQRSTEIRKGLEEGRQALEAAQAQLAAAEEKMRRLEPDIASFKASAAQEIEADRERLRRAAEREAERILESARHSIETATRAAKLELRGYAARQAYELAEKFVRDRLSDEARARLVQRFIQGVGNGVERR